jgi:hypothetical protein
MTRLLYLMLLLLIAAPETRAQQADVPVDEDGSSEQTERSDDAFRRSRELEDARARDQTYTDTNYGPQKELEKIDKLPEESRDNIRDQLIDVIVEDGEWEPSDALEDYPYTPTEAARSDPELKKLEQEAWDEQIEKYHEREAAAWGAHRGPVPGPGNPTGQQGGSLGESGASGQQGGQQGNGQGGSNGGTAGTYRPYESRRNGEEEDAASTAGVSESALDFLKRQQASGQMPQPPGAPAAQNSDGSLPQAAPQAEQIAQQEVVAEEAASEAIEAASETAEPDLEARGIIAIEDLDKLEGAGRPIEDTDEEEEP